MHSPYQSNMNRSLNVPRTMAPIGADAHVRQSRTKKVTGRPLLPGNGGGANGDYR